MKLIKRILKITALKGEEIPQNWKTTLKGLLKGGVEGLMEQFIKDNPTKAKVLGRADGQEVLSYLRQEAVVENLRYEEETNDKTRYSVIATTINEAVQQIRVKQEEKGGKSKTPSPSVNATSINALGANDRINKGRCAIS